MDYERSFLLSVSINKEVIRFNRRYRNSVTGNSIYRTRTYKATDRRILTVIHASTIYHHFCA